jgi:hypothetical protein
MTRSEPGWVPSDEELLRSLEIVLEEEEPLPAGAVGFAVEAFAWRDMEVELAQLLHDSALEEAVVLRDDVCLRLLVLQSGDLTLDIEHAPDHLTGAVFPSGRYRVEIHGADPEHRSSPLPSTLTDAAGMFEVQGEIRGAVRFVVSDPDGGVAILSPWITL